MDKKHDLVLLAVSALEIYRFIIERGIFPFFIPVFFTLVAFFIYRIFIDDNKRSFILPYAQMTGIILWYYVSVVLSIFFPDIPEVKKISEQIDSISLIDITILLMLLIWLIIRPGLIPAIASIIYSVVQVILSSMILAETFDNTIINFQESRRELFILTFGLLILGIAEYLKSKNKPEDSSPNASSSI